MPYTYQRIRCAICNDCNRQQWRFVSSSFSFLRTLCVRRSHGERRLRGQLSSGQVEKNIMEHASKDSSTKGSSATRAIYTDGSEPLRSEEHTSELQSLMRISYAVFCLKKKKSKNYNNDQLIQIMSR